MCLGEYTRAMTAGETAQQVKETATKPDNLSLIIRTTW